MGKKAFLLGVATAVPSQALTQEQYINFMAPLLNLNDTQIARMRKFAENMAINTRHTVITDMTKPSGEWAFFNSVTKQFPTTQQRNELYKQTSVPLAVQAASKLMAQWGRPVSEITHVIIVSCTGFMAPGIEFFLIQQLGLSPSVQRLMIGFMGCFGAFRGLAVAQALAQQDPKNRILIVCVELCSLHIQPTMDLGTIIGNMLFADGVSALLVGDGVRDGEKSLWEIVRCASTVISNSPSLITWDIGDHGFLMHLSNKVPQCISSEIKKFSDVLLGDIQSDNADWPIHPGGPMILNAIEAACGLSRAQTSSSWFVLAQYGNMSSATFPFVLEHLSQQQTRKPWAVGLGFGPGVSVEGVLLKTCG